MATYKVWLTVKDRYGNTKEIDGGNIDVGLGGLTEDDVEAIGVALPFSDYLRKDEAVKELDPHFTTDPEVEQAIERNDALKYGDFQLRSNGGN